MKICKGCKTTPDKEIKKEVKKIQAAQTLDKINYMQTRPLMPKLPSPIIQTRPLIIEPEKTKLKLNTQLIIGGIIALWLIKNK
jgi:hypothetical protein|tara:strand:- start:3710 stop:3958 length:249 start_codon:yes stop_codon:yes gene_type:complete